MKKAVGKAVAQPLLEAGRTATADYPPPPVVCGDLGMRIDRGGTWFYHGTPIGRKEMVCLFASLLERRADGSYWLVAPGESGRIEVEDVPFMAVEMFTCGCGRDKVISFRTNVDEWVEAGPSHALRFEEDATNGGLKPLLHVRSDLWAKVTRALFYDLVELGQEREVGGKLMFGVASGTEFYPMAEASALKEFL